MTKSVTCFAHMLILIALCSPAMASQTKSDQRAQLSLQPCDLPGVNGEALCGKYEVFEDCAADEVCHKAFPDLRKEFAAVLARFDKGPVVTEVINPSTRQRETVKIARGNFVEQLRLMLYTTHAASFVPLLIHKAFENDYLTFDALARRYNPGRLVARGMYLTVTCSESVPFITEQEILKETKGTFVDDYRVRRHIEACKEWPRGNIPRSFTDPVKSDAPVLLISGDLDASTPYWLGEEVIKYLPNGSRVLIKNYGHQMDGQCITEIISRFIEKGSAKGLDTTCTERIRRPPFVTEMPK